MKRYLVFITDPYVRDAQAFTKGDLDHDPLEDEFGWHDVGGPMLVIDRSYADIDELKLALSRLYPDADPNIFEVLEVESAKEVAIS